MKPEGVGTSSGIRAAISLLYDLLRAFCQTEVSHLLIPLVVIFPDPVLEKTFRFAQFQFGIDAGYVVSFFKFLSHPGDKTGIKSNGLGEFPNAP